MFGTHDFLLFVLSGLLLNITPGPDLIYIVSRSTSGGMGKGLVAVAGIGAGCLVHIVAASLGLSAILATSAMAFIVVKVVGAAYLVYVGLNSILSSSKGLATKLNQVPSAVSRRKVFVQGFFTNALNPKVALFFMAFLPQFISPNASCKAGAFAFLGIVFWINGMIVCMLAAWLSARLASNLLGNRGIMRWFERCTGGLFVFLGIRLAMAENA
ncbi:LysE family translocator [Salidesulfovibrio onnuriiensis]|uniref:LysE family translocator n=1 Tax=Salidesulfovibrio onnuriiensis TaxID=2583823 RepID=UPI0011C9D293|nr:LysE family translocator [Salidesulfovibrio onnuriiensis]